LLCQLVVWTIGCVEWYGLGNYYLEVMQVRLTSAVDGHDLSMKHILRITWDK